MIRYHGFFHVRSICYADYEANWRFMHVSTEEAKRVVGQTIFKTGNGESGNYRIE